MLKAFYLSKKWLLWSWGGSFLILFCIYTQTMLTVKLNDWYGNFYNLLQNVPQANGDLDSSNADNTSKDTLDANSLDTSKNTDTLDTNSLESTNTQDTPPPSQSTQTHPAKKHSTYEEFLKLIKEFCYIAFQYIAIATIIGYFSRLFTFAWREAITFAYIDKWKTTQKDIEGSSQRIQEDIYKFAQIMERMGVSLIKALMTLIAFLPILYNFGKTITVPIFSGDYSLVLWAIIASIGGLIISWVVGIKLPHLEYDNQKAEASFRKELVYAEDDKQNYADKETILELFSGLRLSYKRLFLHYGYFDVWLYLYEQSMSIFAILLIGKNLFSGMITLGVLMQIDNAFDKVRSSFSILTTNWTLITELRSVHKRLKEFEKHIDF